MVLIPYNSRQRQNTTSSVHQDTASLCPPHALIVQSLPPWPPQKRGESLVSDSNIKGISQNKTLKSPDGAMKINGLGVCAVVSFKETLWWNRYPNINQDPPSINVFNTSQRLLTFCLKQYLPKILKNKRIISRLFFCETKTNPGQRSFVVSVFLLILFFGKICKVLSDSSHVAMWRIWTKISLKQITQIAISSLLLL